MRKLCSVGENNWHLCNHFTFTQFSFVCHALPLSVTRISFQAARHGPPLEQTFPNYVAKVQSNKIPGGLTVCCGLHIAAKLSFLFWNSCNFFFFAAGLIFSPSTNRTDINPLTPHDPYSGRTAPLTSKRCILYIYSTNIGTEYFKHGINSPFFPLQNAVCFIILTYLGPVLFTFYIQGVLKFKK